MTKQEVLDELAKTTSRKRKADLYRYIKRLKREGLWR